MISENLAGSILESLGYKKDSAISEAKKKDEPKVETPAEPVAEAEVHVCPLCESKLEKGLDESVVDAFVNSLLTIEEEDESDEGDEVDEAKKGKGLPKNLSNVISKGQMSGKKK